MGRPKQLLLINKKQLIVHATDTALESIADRVVVVLGANDKELSAVLANSTAKIVINRNWEKGMGTSLKLGLKFLVKDLSGLDGVLVMVCDQPLVTTAHLNSLISTQPASGKGIAASAYAGTLGVPALFQKKFFDEIMSLGDDEGAKKLISKHPNDISSVAFPDGAIDLDTPEDYRNFAG